MDDETYLLALGIFRPFSNVSLLQGIDEICYKLNLDKLSDSVIEDAFQQFKIAQFPPNKERSLVENVLFHVFVAYSDLKNMADLTHSFVEIKPGISCAQTERLAIYSLTDGATISIIDHFCGGFRDFPIKNMPNNIKPINSYKTHLIDNERILQTFEGVGHIYYLCLLKLDISNSVVEYLDHIQFEIFCRYIYLDELNPSRFITGHDEENWCIRRIDDDKIVFEKIIDTECQLHLTKFTGDLIFGFCIYVSERTRSITKIELRYCEQNLSTDESKIFESKLPLKLERHGNGRLGREGRKFVESCYHWSGDQFFFVDQNDEIFFVHMFDKVKQKWDTINVYGCGIAKDVYLDQSGILSISCVRNVHDLETFRFPLRKPDTLNNIVWFNIRRLHILFKSQICDQTKKCLPNDSKLHSILPRQKLHVFVNLKRGIGLDVYEIGVSSTDKGIYQNCISLKVVVVLRQFLVVI